jgi:adenylosuccinate synthase
MIIDLPVLLREIEECDVDPARLHIDRNAVLISAADREQEANERLGYRVRSTLTGTGAATARKVLRSEDVALASSVAELQPYLADASEELNRRIDHGEYVIIEGTQGFGLSLHHSVQFPYATSRDTTSANFLAEAGLSPRLVDDIYLVLRTYPIRVSGNSGPLKDELTWETIKERAGYVGILAEYTTVTGRLRRVGEFDWELAGRAVGVNRPTGIAIHGADYLDYRDYGKSCWTDLTENSRAFVHTVESRLHAPVSFVFTGPGEGHLIDRRSSGGGAVTTGNFISVGTAT